MAKNYNQKKKGIKFVNNKNLTEKFINNLPFTLTESQNKAWGIIYEDLISSNQMVRLLQGDVGCGKTIVAVLTASIVVGHKSQVAIMAPTEI